MWKDFFHPCLPNAEVPAAVGKHSTRSGGHENGPVCFSAHAWFSTALSTAVGTFYVRHHHRSVTLCGYLLHSPKAHKSPYGGMRGPLLFLCLPPPLKAGIRSHSCLRTRTPFAGVDTHGTPSIQARKLARTGAYPLAGKAQDPGKAGVRAPDKLSTLHCGSIRPGTLILHFRNTVPGVPCSTRRSPDTHRRACAL